MIITLSRQYASGGAAVAERVAEQLGWTVVDNALVEQVAERSGYAKEDVASLDESVPTFLERFAQSTALSFPEFLLSAPQMVDEPEAVKLAHVTRDLLAELGRQDRVVMVGRAAAAVLARDSGAMHVRLVASQDHRVRQASAALGVSEDEARKTLEETDLTRQRYHSELYGRDWNDPVNYHMVLNTEWLGIEGAADVIVARARAVGW